MASCRKKPKNRRREKVDSREGDDKQHNFSFLNIDALDRLAGNLDCSFFSTQGDDDDDELEIDFYDDESILSSDDEGTYESFDSRGKLGTIEDEVEEALEWADRHMLFCGRNR